MHFSFVLNGGVIFFPRVDPSETSTTCYSAEACDASRSPKASIARPMTVSENLA